MKKFTAIVALLIVCSASAQNAKEAIGTQLDLWHRAAAKGQFDNYFSLMTPDAIFIGTDPMENWNIAQFKAFAKPYFDKGAAWDFKPVQRNIYVQGDIAWFDELLDTWMKLCRGSGVMKKVNGKWLIQHYVLSITIPNDNATEVVKIIAPLEDAALEQLKKK